MSDEKKNDETEGCDSCDHCKGCGEPEGDAPEKPATDAENDEPETEEDK